MVANKLIGIESNSIRHDVVCVVSGFVITNVLLRESASRSSISTPSFYARRIRRILPAATVVLVATVFATYHWLSFITGASVAEDAKYVALSIGNFHFASIGTQYFAANQPPSTLRQFCSLACPSMEPGAPPVAEQVTHRALLGGTDKRAVENAAPQRQSAALRPNQRS